MSVVALDTTASRRGPDVAAIVAVPLSPRRRFRAYASLLNVTPTKRPRPWSSCSTHCTSASRLAGADAPTNAPTTWLKMAPTLTDSRSHTPCRPAAACARASSLAKPRITLRCLASGSVDSVALAYDSASGAMVALSRDTLSRSKSSACAALWANHMRSANWPLQL